MNYEKLPNGDYLIEASRIWMDENGFEFVANICFLISSVTSIEEYNDDQVRWADRRDKTFISFSIDHPSIIIIEYELMKRLWIRYNKELSLNWVNYGRN